MAEKRILIVDDEEEIRDLLEFDIAHSGYITDTASNGEEGLKKALQNNYDLIILDVMMPKINGFDVCKNIRLAHIDTPILMLTAKGTIDDKTQGFEKGADDYLVKPFDIKEVLLRIRALLRRNESGSASTNGSKEILRAGDIEILPDSLEAVILDKKVKLTPTEFEILYCVRIDAWSGCFYMVRNLSYQRQRDISGWRNSDGCTNKDYHGGVAWHYRIFLDTVAVNGDPSDNNGICF